MVQRLCQGARPGVTGTWTILTNRRLTIRSNFGSFPAGRLRVRWAAVRVYYGWVVVAVLSITETVSWGIIYYGFPVFLRAMEEDLAASRVAVTGAFSVGMGIAALCAVPVGRWLDRHGPRLLMTVGSCLATLLVVAWSRVETLGALYAVWAVMGLALAATLYEPAFAAVVSWFATRHRDRALLVVTLAGGLASTIFMPISAWLLVGLGWRTALVVLAVVLAVITIPLHALALRAGPRASPPHAGTGMPACVMSASSPTVFMLTVLPPVFGPLMSRMRWCRSSVSDTGITLFRCLRSTSCSSGCLA